MSRRLPDEPSDDEGDNNWDTEKADQALRDRANEALRSRRL